MCGLVGIAGTDGPNLIERATRSLHHRGPDDAGIVKSDTLSLGHTRLSILGLNEVGHQPVTGEGGAVLLFNGEIYNYLEIAEELAALGRRPNTRCDTLVLMQALETWGLDALPKLNGMFAFAWFDPRDETVIMARDRWGKKPLFWGIRRNSDGRRGLVFASEFRTIAELPGAPDEPDPMGVARYMLYDGMPGTRTVFKNIAKVPAGSWIRTNLKGEFLASRTYWSLDLKPVSIGPSEALERVDGLLAQAIRVRLRSDVPVGLFLSGGVDSALIASTWRSICPDAPIETFTLGFSEQDFDERGPARIVAGHIGSEHHELVCDEAQLHTELTAVLDGLSEPLADPSLIPTALLSRFARERVKVALSGDGGDEFQAGYAPFRAWRLGKALASPVLRNTAKTILRAVERWAPVNSQYLSLKFKCHHFAQGLSGARNERIQRWMAAVELSRLAEILHPDLVSGLDFEEVLAPTRSAFDTASPAGELKAQMASWIATYLESSILAKVDRASMTHSLEVRAPLLDVRLTAFLAGLPDHLIYHRGRGKVLLRELASQRLPPSITRRPKKGFGVPLNHWYRTVLKDHVQSLAQNHFTNPWFSDHGVNQLLKEHRSGHADHQRAIWNILVAQGFQG